MTLKGQGRDHDMYGAQYPENGWIYRLDYNRPPGLSNSHVADNVT